MPATPNGPSLALANGTAGMQLGYGNPGDTPMTRQAAPAALVASGTLTAAQLGGALVTMNNGAGTAITLPLATDMDAQFPNIGIDSAFDLSVLSLGAGAATITTNTGWTLVGLMVVPATNALRFRARRTAVGAWTLYQLA